jgi:hypothetical protein
MSLIWSKILSSPKGMSNVFNLVSRPEGQTNVCNLESSPKGQSNVFNLESNLDALKHIQLQAAVKFEEIFM